MIRFSKRLVAAVQISIPNPCGEDFSAMQQVKGGKYCGQCAQVVTDFTKMTDAQLIDWMQNRRGGCGTFRPDQLNRDLIRPVGRKAPFGMSWVLSLLIMTGCVREPEQKKPQKTEQAQDLGGIMIRESPKIDTQASRKQQKEHAQRKRMEIVAPELIAGDMEVTGGVPAWPGEPPAAIATVDSTRSLTRSASDALAAPDSAKKLATDQRPGKAGFWKRVFSRR